MMAPISVAADYLVVGAGASGMAFVDELINVMKEDVEVIMLDSRAKPGGHWNDAYDFVRLHQPAATYGVNSRSLGNGGADLASKQQILSYYELVMEDLLATGRVKFFPQCWYKGHRRFVSLVAEGIEYQVTVRRKIVDATIQTTRVPATTVPNYVISPGVHHVPINGLAKLDKAWGRYVIIGAGKTGLDAILHLIDNHVDPNNICWVVSHDCWFINRDKLKDPDHFHTYISLSMAGLLESDGLDDVYRKYEANGVFLRLDSDIWPTKMRAASVSPEEIEKFRKISHIVRQGRIEEIKPTEIVFKNGHRIPTDEDSLHVDCSVNGSMFPELRKIFDGDHIHMQLIQIPPTGLSSAIIAALEVMFPQDEERKNEICCPLNPPQNNKDWFTMSRISTNNGNKIADVLGFRWIRSRRTHILHHLSLPQLARIMPTMLWNKENIRQRLESLAPE